MHLICDNCKIPSKKVGRLTKMSILIFKNRTKFGTYHLTFRKKHLCRGCVLKLVEKNKVIFDRDD